MTLALERLRLTVRQNAETLTGGALLDDHLTGGELLCYGVVCDGFDQLIFEAGEVRNPFEKGCDFSIGECQSPLGGSA